MSPPALPPAFPVYTFPAPVGPGLVPLPPSESGVLLTLSLQVDASNSAALAGVGAPIARSYDGHPWEVATTELTAQLVSLIPGGSTNESSSVDLPEPQVSQRYYRLDRYELRGGANISAERLASRFLMQATFGPTLTTVRDPNGLARDGGGESYAARLTTFEAAARDWVSEQMATPMTLLRAHYRQRVNPRMSHAQRNPFIDNRPACRPGSTWHTFTFNEWDRGAAVTFEGLPRSADGTHGYQVSIQGELRTELRFSGTDANWTQVTNGHCTGMLELITSIDECTAAAVALGANWNNNGGSYSSTPGAADDGRIASDRGPRGCYLEGKPPVHYPDPGYPERWTHTRSLYFNSDDTNTGKCLAGDVCLCRRVRLNEATWAPSVPPSAPPVPPRAPGSTATNLTAPDQCDPTQCCVVLYKGAAGANCGRVPIFDFTNWVHPGGADLVTPSMLCGSVRFNWLSKSSSHGVCDSIQNCDPEADIWDTPLVGGAVRVGTYVDRTSAGCSSSTLASSDSRRTFKMCSLEEGINGEVDFVPEGVTCCTPYSGITSCATHDDDELFTLPNPAIVLPSDHASIDPLRAQSVADADIAMTRVPGEAAADTYLLERIDVPCALSSKRSPSHIEVQATDGGASTWYRLDRRLSFQTNTLASPCVGIASDSTTPYDGVANACPSVVRTSWLNGATCTRQLSCAQPNFVSTRFQLNFSSLRAYYEQAGVLAYAVRGLRMDDKLDNTAVPSQSPCEPGISRWERLAYAPCVDIASSSGGGADTALDNATREAIEATLVASSDTNEYFKDIDVIAYLNAHMNGSCSSSYDGISAMGARLTIAGSCWRQVPRQEGNVYAFSYWASIHDGNDDFDDNANPIERFAKAGGVHIDSPSGHTMKDRWWNTVRYQSAHKQGGRRLPHLGRFGDVVDFATLPAAGQPREMALYLGSAVVTISTPFASEGAAEQTCGSPGEVSSEPLLGHRYKTWMGDKHPGRNALLVPHNSLNGKMMVWTTVVLSAVDQLRQRAAFALSQILVIGQKGLDVQKNLVEAWLVYYDIFVRHAFGSYRNILIEVTHSPMMSKYLTFHSNRALHVAGTNPDENYAREIMQLFSIGLWMLRSDGTYETDAAGQFVPTYDNEDIMAFARVFTGYYRQATRANQEDEGDIPPFVQGEGSQENYIDPVYLDAFSRGK